MLSPRMAYVLLWFPLSSETFVFREIQQLVQRGMDIRVYTMYGEKLRGCSDEMKNYAGPIKRFGSVATLRLLKAFWRAWKRDRETVKTLMRRGLFRKMRNLEAYAENLWCFLAGFLLAEEAQRDGIELLHSSWGNGPATAVWVASRLSGIPFAFTGRAGDIYPQDGILAEKSRDAIFIRTNNMANKPWLQSFCPAGQKDKVHVIYNGLTLGRRVDCRAPFQKPYRLLAIGRFARTKGFPELLTAMARLRDDGFPVRLTLVGDGNWKRKLVEIRKRLHLEDLVDMPGFVPNDRIRTFMEEHDMLVVPSVVHTNGDRDGIPNVIMEALSCGMPVVATDVCGVGEVIRDGETGYLIPQRDPAALADAIRRMLSDREAALRMAQTGRELVFRMFDTETNIAALQDLYCQQYTQWRATHGPNV
ncbi:glycosyltransferase family 4 protein [Desulfovibrio sp.]|uniref:glycosyltransferase family 4 protein n=1 Tax=Desulfovibrio sp. TaxID=885 RepID=UPI002579485F|nr:glycosyltransferase family 4 protein [Desulfovibrio sp.]MBR2609981.1 glycosyltransferase family 4 protein [Desulfovibrio sp.]